MNVVIYQADEAIHSLKGQKCIGGSTPVKINIQNNFHTSLKVAWVDYEGNQIVYCDNLESGTSRDFDTYQTHTWVLQENNTPFAVFFVTPMCQKNCVSITVSFNRETKVTNSQVQPIPTQVQPIPNQVQPSIVNGIVQCTSKYQLHNIHGFKVFAEPSVTQPVFAALNEDFYKMTQSQDPAPLKLMQSIGLYVNTKIRFGKQEIADNWNGAVFHPGAGWLTENGNLAEKAGCVEMYTTDDYLKRRTHFGHIDFVSNWLLHHEMGHGYHFLLNDWQHSDIDDVWQYNMDIGRYNSVNHIQGGKLKAYGCDNCMEYFASISASYYAHNDYAPFDRAELKTFDPEGFAQIEKYWHLSAQQMIAMNPKLQNILG